jgi:hypothetical protein
MDFIFLQANQPLTKSYTRESDGTITKSSYPNVFEFSSIAESVTSLEQLASVMQHHADQGHCMLKGLVNRTLKNESRAGSTATNDSTSWICLDLDGVDCADVPTFLKELGLQGISYVVQYSASSLLADNLLRCHIIMQLDKPQPAPLCKQWLIDLNHKTPLLRDNMTLTRTDNSIRWPLDISRLPERQVNLYRATYPEETEGPVCEETAY